MTASAWEEQPVLEFILSNNTLLRAYHTVTTQYSPPGNTAIRTFSQRGRKKTASVGS